MEESEGSAVGPTDTLRGLCRGTMSDNESYESESVERISMKHDLIEQADRKITAALLFVVMTFVPTVTWGADVLADSKLTTAEWPWWRGPMRNGIAADQKPPVRWSANDNVIWKAPVVGRGHGSPIVVGNQVILNTADVAAGTQHVVCYSRKTGELQWNTTVHRGGLHVKGKKKPNEKASWASTTPACDGQLIFVSFYSDNAIHVTALDRSGRQVWQKKLSDYIVHQGYAASPTIFGSLVIASADNKGGGLFAALDRQTGNTVWQNQRPSKPNYASPVILSAAGREQLLFTGCDRVASFDPLSGKELWQIEGSTTECVTTAVTDGERVFSSGGYPQNHVSAIRADGSGEIVWQNNVRVYVPSMLVREGYLYAVADAGVAMCWESATGREMWKGRLRGTFSASPVMVGDYIYATNESGRTFVYHADPKKFTPVAENDLGDLVMATPTFVDGQIFMRVAFRNDDTLQETLFCLGETK